MQWDEPFNVPSDVPLLVTVLVPAPGKGPGGRGGHGKTFPDEGEGRRVHVIAEGPGQSNNRPTVRTSEPLGARASAARHASIAMVGSRGVTSASCVGALTADHVVPSVRPWLKDSRSHREGVREIGVD